jgi:membrane associated rhomboid family serine protease
LRTRRSALSGGQLAVRADRQRVALSALSFLATCASARAVYLLLMAPASGVYHERGGRSERDDCWPGPTILAEFEVWRYFSHALMHFSLMHILFNLLWWWYLGGAVEKRSAAASWW